MNAKIDKPMDFLEYQQLPDKLKNEYMDRVLNLSIDTWFYEQERYRKTGNLFFMKEFFTHRIDDFLDLKNQGRYEDVIHLFFYRKLYENTNEIEIKNELVSLFIDKKKIQINTKLNKVPLLHIAAVQNSVDFIEHLVNLGAKTNIIDDDNDSFASSTMCLGENLEVLKFALTLNDFNPLKGKNILKTALDKNCDDSVQLILNTPFVANDNFIQKAQKSARFNVILPYYEKALLEQTTIENNEIKIRKNKI